VSLDVRFGRCRSGVRVAPVWTVDEEERLG
jgi:hypothetical protein